MSDMDIDYPPTATITLGDALERAEANADDADSDGNANANANWDTYRDGLQWAVDQWGADATITLQAFTASSRARIIDAAESSTVGELGRRELRAKLIVGSAIDAPWLAGDEALAERLRIADVLPPALLDYLDAEVTDLNDLGN